MKFLIYVTLISCIISNFNYAQDNVNPDKIIKSDLIKGNLIGFEIGDYCHAVIRTDKKDTLSFFVNELLTYYLVENIKNNSEFKYNKINRYFEEGGGYYIIEVLDFAKTDSSNFNQWIKNFINKSNTEKFKKKYNKLIDKYTINK